MLDNILEGFETRDETKKVDEKNRLKAGKKKRVKKNVAREREK